VKNSGTKQNFISGVWALAIFKDHKDGIFETKSKNKLKSFSVSLDKNTKITVPIGTFQSESLEGIRKFLIDMVNRTIDASKPYLKQEKNKKE